MEIFLLYFNKFYRNEDFKNIYAQRYKTSSNGLHQWVNKSMYNAKRAKINVDDILGCKSGYTNEAKSCLSSLNRVNDNEIITIVGHSVNNDVKTHAAVSDTLDIMNYVGQHYSLQNILTKGAKVRTLDVTLAKDEQKIAITNLNDVSAFLPNDFNKDDLEYKYSFKKLEAPVKKGEKVGDLKVYYQDKLLYQEEYATTKEIEKDTFSYILGVVKDFMFPYGLAIILVIIYILILRMKKR